MIVTTPARAAAVLALALVTAAAGAAAQTLAAPVGGRSVRLPAGRLVCPDHASHGGWIVDPDRRGVRPPTAPEAVGQTVTVAISPDLRGCAHPEARLSLLALGPRPAVDAATVTVDVDGARAAVRGRELRGVILRWAGGGQSGTDACTDPQPAGAAETCAFAVGRGLPADAAAIDLAFLPPGTRVAPDVTYHDAVGRPLAPEDYTVHPARVLVARLVAPDAAVDVRADASRIRLAHPEAVGSVECADAACAVEGDDLVVRNARGTGDALDVRLHLRPHVFVPRGAGFDASPVAPIPVQRCPVVVVSPALLRGVPDQSVVVRVGGRCAQEGALQFATRDGVGPAERTELLDDALYAVVRVDRAGGDVVPVTVLRQGTVVGVARAATRPAPTVHARLEIPERGEIDFIPTNREARLLLPATVSGASLHAVPVEGVYEVRRDASGRDHVRAVEGAAGSVPLRLALRDRSLPPALRDVDLARISEPIARAIRAAHIPVALAASARSGAPVVELVCADGDGGRQRIAPGDFAAVPYRARDACRLVFHRDRLPPEDGTQIVRVTVEVVTRDGERRNEARIEQDVTLRPGRGTREVPLGGARAPFDRFLVRASLPSSGTHYAMPPDETVGTAQVQWSVVLGVERFRVFATTTIPAGLYRISEPERTGILTLNFGALFRLVPLTREGVEWPIGLELGALWVGIAGDAGVASAARGQTAFIAGLGIAIPVATGARSANVRVGFHLWGEFEFSRLLPGGVGSPWAFVFGPSLSFGEFGVNF